MNLREYFLSSFVQELFSFPGVWYPDVQFLYEHERGLHQGREHHRLLHPALRAEAGGIITGRHTLGREAG